MPAIDPKRLLDDLKRLRQFGATGSGVVRTTYSEIDMQSRRWLVQKMDDAGLHSTIDGVGNVIGRARQSSRCVLLGSHTDTQPTGGWLDGALGVIYGLEIARSLGEEPGILRYGVDVASWADEEGSYLGMIGSRSFCGQLDEEEILGARGKDGRSLPQALADCGLSGLPRSRVDPNRHLAYLEAHIEQGPYLERQQNKIGVVTSIVGMRDFELVFTGQQNHAGTTPMPLRRDAGAKLIEFADGLASAMRENAAENTVWTIGNVRFEPGTSSIIPGRARMLWQFRDPDEALIRDLERLLRDRVESFNQANEVQVSLRVIDQSARAAAMDPYLQDHLATAAEARCPGKWEYLPSGAAHDAQTMSTCLPSAMMFIPSIGGISHSFDEDTDEEDIVLGCQVMADAVHAILQDQSHG